MLQRPKVYNYVLDEVDNASAPGNVWRTAEDCPPLETDAVSLYLGPSRALSFTLPSRQDVYTFTYDPASPCSTHGGANVSLPSGPFDQREVSKRAYNPHVIFSPQSLNLDLGSRLLN